MPKLIKSGFVYHVVCGSNEITESVAESVQWRFEEAAPCHVCSDRGIKSEDHSRRSKYHRSHSANESSAKTFAKALSTNAGEGLRKSL